MSSSDLYQSNSCGYLNLADIKNQKYDKITDGLCNSPWSPQIEETWFTNITGYQEVMCGYYRPLSSYSSDFYTAIKIGQTITFKAGFNIYSSNVDGNPDARDNGSLISVSWMIMDGC